jgi:hypothetical protein
MGMEAVLVSLAIWGMGVLLGHNIAWARAASDVQIVAKLRAAAQGICMRKKFTGADCLNSWEAEYVTGERSMHLIMVTTDDAKRLVPLSTTDDAQGAE